MNTHERFARMYAHQEADRVPMMDSPWDTTIERWRREGMPTDDYVAYFDLDRIGRIGIDYSPRYPVEVLEETPEYVIHTTGWGATLKTWRHMTSTPEFLDFRIKDEASWEEAKARMKPDPARINWDYLKKNVPLWQREGRWIIGDFWFGFDVTHSWAVGTTRLLYAMADNPEWVEDMFNTYLDINLAMMQMVLDAGYPVDEIYWPDDMGYKNTQFFSLNMYRNLLKPVQKRAVDWIHERGMKAHLHSCGLVDKFVPEFVEIGIDALNPLEVKAGMDPVALKAAWGDRLVFHGGINAVLWDQPGQIEAEMERIIPLMKENGGYIFASDHSIPDSVSLEDFTHIIETYKKVARY